MTVGLCPCVCPCVHVSARARVCVSACACERDVCVCAYVHARLRVRVCVQNVCVLGAGSLFVYRVADSLSVHFRAVPVIYHNQNNSTMSFLTGSTNGVCL